MLSQRRLWRLLHARRWCLRHRSILMGRDKWNVFPIVALYCEPSPAMSASRPAAAAIATVSTGVGVGAGFRNPAPARNAKVPPVLTTCKRVTAFNILMQSTSRATSVYTEDALFGKVKGNVKLILKFITEWCRKCPSEVARNPGVFVPAEPPSGTDMDWMFDAHTPAGRDCRSRRHFLLLFGTWCFMLSQFRHCRHAPIRTSVLIYDKLGNVVFDFTLTKESRGALE